MLSGKPQQQLPVWLHFDAQFLEVVVVHIGEVAPRDRLGDKNVCNVRKLGSCAEDFRSDFRGGEVHETLALYVVDGRGQLVGSVLRRGCFVDLVM